MHSIITDIENKQRKAHVVPVRSGDTVRVSQRIEEGGKSRVQVFEGLVIRTRRQNSLSAVITVRRIASGVGVEKTFPMHSPTVEKIEVIKRSNVRRNYLSYMRDRTGKRARLGSVEFDRAGVNYIPDPKSEELPEEVVEAIEKSEQVIEDEAPAEDKAEAKDDKSDKPAEEAKADDKKTDNKSDSKGSKSKKSADAAKSEDTKSDSKA